MKSFSPFSFSSFLALFLFISQSAAYDVNKAILEADMTTPSTGRDESADLFFSQLDEEAADKAAANFNAAVKQDACFTTSSAPVCPPRSGDSVNNPVIQLKAGCQFVVSSPNFGSGNYPNGPYSCSWTFTTNNTDARNLLVGLGANDFAVAGDKNNHCVGDNVKITNVATNVVAPRLKKAIEGKSHKFCGKWDKDVEINTKANTIRVTFNVNEKVNAKGFRLAVTGKADLRKK